MNSEPALKINFLKIIMALGKFLLFGTQMS